MTSPYDKPRSRWSRLFYKVGQTSLESKWQILPGHSQQGDYNPVSPTSAIRSSIQTEDIVSQDFVAPILYTFSHHVRFFHIAIPYPSSGRPLAVSSAYPASLTVVADQADSSFFGNSAAVTFILNLGALLPIRLAFKLA